MVKRRWFGSALLLLLAAAPSCLGGQTGQPSALNCEPVLLSPCDTWEGLTAEELASTFEGTQRATLSWVERGESVLTEELIITVDPSGATGTERYCGTMLDLEVAVEIATSDSGLLERGVATLSFDSWDTVDATMKFHGSTLDLSGNLSAMEVGEAPRGTVTPRPPGTPGTSGSYR